ncbi:hypothetical protein [Pseudolabrys sp. FHR47]|uniref:hypothetical protein n=1 Tax=Pseudolabrys sp. FHR47 TaxID=2562284 RepID=UPI0010BE37C2|nr:hypothetical protein [Pseudolabrys sp. FHR47]
MTLSRINIAMLALVAATLGAGSAEAQWYSSVQSAPAPLYPYAQPSRTATQPYAVEVAPGAYVIHRPGEVVAPARRAAPAPQVKSSQVKSVRTKNDPALIEELRQRASGNKAVINTTKVVYKKPKVVETKRYVDLPPRVVERYTVVDDTDGGKKVEIDAPAAEAQGKKGKPAKDKAKGGPRVIQADAEITILGPDRMTIQLYRKGELGKPGARLN